MHTTICGYMQGDMHKAHRYIMWSNLQILRRDLNTLYAESPDGENEYFTHIDIDIDIDIYIYIGSFFIEKYRTNHTYFKHPLVRWKFEITLAEENIEKAITKAFIAFSLKSPKVSAHGHGGGPWSDKQDLISVYWLLMY